MQRIDIGTEIAPQHAFGREFVEGVSAYAAERKNWRLHALRQEDVANESFGCCQGVIIRVFGDRAIRIARDRKIPLVDVYCAKPHVGIGQVIPDEAAAGRLAAEFFHSRGFTNFAFCGMNALAYSTVCQNAFVQAVREFGYEADVYAVPTTLRGRIPFDKGTPYSVPDATQLRKWLRSLPKPVALFCCNDHRAYQVMSIAFKVRIDIPHEIALLGCDNDTMLCSFSPVPISSIDPNARKVGYTAARLLNSMIGRPPDKRHHKIVMIPPKGIVERASTEHAPFSPAWLAESILKIERELANGISATDIFALSGHSVPHVEKVFREKMGLSVQNYILRARMNRAVSLLKQAQLSIKEIATACGYASPQYFCRAFKARFGTTPGRYG